MRIFADENIARAIIDWLRSSGHDVVSAAEGNPGASDTYWLEMAEREQRIVLTSDKDFGSSCFATN